MDKKKDPPLNGTSLAHMGLERLANCKPTVPRHPALVDQGVGGLGQREFKMIVDGP